MFSFVIICPLDQKNSREIPQEILQVQYLKFTQLCQTDSKNNVRFTFMSCVNLTYVLYFTKYRLQCTVISSIHCVYVMDNKISIC